MGLTILSKLAAFSLRKPKTILFAVGLLAVAIFAAHYRLIVNERDKLRVAEEAYESAVEAFELREETLQEDIRIAAEATARLTAERDAHRASIDQLRAGREDDPEAQAWGEQQLPTGEVIRLCAALPEMAGC